MEQTRPPHGANGSGPESSTVDILQQQANNLIRDFTAETLSFNALPQSILDADFVHSAHLNIELFFRYLAEGIEPSEAATRPLVDRATELIRDGMSVSEALGNYREGARFFWAQLVPLVEEQEPAMLQELGSRLTGYLGLITARIAEALVADVRQPHWELLEHQHEIADALLTGRSLGGWVGDPETPLADAYLVTAIRMGAAAPGALTAVRRALAAEPGTLLHRDSAGWTALLPLRGERLPDPLQSLAHPKTTAAEPHPQLWIGIAPAASHDAIPQAYSEARIVADAARCLRRPEIVCRHRDMVLEYAIAASGPARKSLTALLIPLTEHPLLNETLDALIDNQLNTSAVARALHVHRNTVHYRLTRIAELTGHDPQQPHGIAALVAARTAATLERNAFQP
ncbi:PucR family transcriptional regulator [Nocardia sp. NPDC088792]|uniref:PucR family transcriptional regulator n=1 Tax=Nocardia sp. NPDC088792 TaxID=3364332 RepID=UPI0037F546EB